MKEKVKVKRLNMQVANIFSDYYFRFRSNELHISFIIFVYAVKNELRKMIIYKQKVTPYLAVGYLGLAEPGRHLAVDRGIIPITMLPIYSLFPFSILNFMQVR